MIEIHGLLDLKNTPIKNVVRLLGVTPSQAGKLTKGDTHNFSVFELKTLLKLSFAWTSIDSTLYQNYTSVVPTYAHQCLNCK
jgi:hypothetical protein